MGRGLIVSPIGFSLLCEPLRFFFFFWDAYIFGYNVKIRQNNVSYERLCEVQQAIKKIMPTKVWSKIFVRPYFQFHVFRVNKTG